MADPTQKIIFFYKQSGPYGCFSNFSSHSVYLKDKVWPTAEHYFQAQKFVGTIYEEDIRKLSNPKQARTEGRDRRKPIRNDWNSIRGTLMREVVFAKFTQHRKIRNILLNTEDAVIIQKTNDLHWGFGKEGRGKNQLGKILMSVRDEIRDLLEKKKLEKAQKPEEEIILSEEETNQEVENEEEESSEEDEQGEQEGEPEDDTEERELMESMNEAFSKPDRHYFMSPTKKSQKKKPRST